MSLTTLDIKEIEQFLRIHGIRPSHHRIRVYHYLVEKRNHPSVDVIYQELVREIPTLSKTTVYSTLELFLEKGVVSLITIDENERRYDADTSLHGHFRCNTCGRIFDVRLNTGIGDLNGMDDFEISESHIYFKGLCPECLKKSTS